MSGRSASPHLDDIVEAIERVREALGDMPLDRFESDWQIQWIVIPLLDRACRDELVRTRPRI